MNLNSLLSDSNVLSSLPDKSQKIEYILRRTEVINASKLLKEKKFISRHKTLLSPSDFFTLKYDKLVHKLYSIPLNSILVSASSDEATVFVRKNRGRSRFEISIAFQTNSQAVAFSERFRASDFSFLWNNPLVYYGSSRCVLALDYSNGSFYPNVFYAHDRSIRDRICFSETLLEISKVASMVIVEDPLPELVESTE
jgi:hypothetical protein